MDRAAFIANSPKCKRPSGRFGVEDRHTLLQAHGDVLLGHGEVGPGFGVTREIFP